MSLRSSIIGFRSEDKCGRFVVCTNNGILTNDVQYIKRTGGVALFFWFLESGGDTWSILHLLALPIVVGSEEFWMAGGSVVEMPHKSAREGLATTPLVYSCGQWLRCVNDSWILFI